MKSVSVIGLLLSAVLVFPLSGILADAPAIAPDRVEEDWQLVIKATDTSLVGPQITTAMRPVSDNSAPFAAFDMNYREFPRFIPGGMQIQVWSGTNVLSTAMQGTAQLNTPGETVTWTQSMSIGAGGTVSYLVQNGQSTTWGQFGSAQGQLSVSYPTALDSLIGYSPDTSVKNSGVSWQSNYVTSMTLVQVRYYAAGRLISTDTTPRSLSLGNSP
jgi:hypothetical protein